MKNMHTELLVSSTAAVTVYGNVPTQLTKKSSESLIGRDRNERLQRMAYALAAFKPKDAWAQPTSATALTIQKPSLPTFCQMTPATTGPMNLAADDVV